MLLKDKKQ